MPAIRTGCSSARRIFGPRMYVAIFRSRRRMSHGISFSAHAADLHGAGEEDRHPITEILRQTPEIPDCRNGRSFCATMTR